jgi:hypothetical protein
MHDADPPQLEQRTETRRYHCAQGRREARQKVLGVDVKGPIGFKKVMMLFTFWNTRV